MPLFYLHVVNGAGFIRDEEGMDLADLEAARAQAIAGIRSIISEEAAQGLLDLRGHIEIADEAQQKREVVDYREAFELHLEGEGV